MKVTFLLEYFLPWDFELSSIDCSKNTLRYLESTRIEIIRENMENVH